MAADVRLVATGGPIDGRGHIGRALSLAEAHWAPGTTIELELLGGTLSNGDLDRARAVGLRQVPPGMAPGPSTITILDVPDPHTAALRFDAARLAVVDDRDVFAGRAAIVIQPSQATWTGPGAASLVLAGYDHVPLSAAIRRRRSIGTERAAGAHRMRLLVCFGGSDPARVTERLVPALAASVDADIDVVVGPSYEGSLDGWPVPVLRDPTDLVERIATTDLALLAAGMMKFEAACLGRPMLLLAVADDQSPVGPAFAATGAAHFLDDGRTIEPAAVVAAVADLLADRQARAELGATAARVVDGDGADRIAAAVEALVQPAGRS